MWQNSGGVRWQQLLLAFGKSDGVSHLSQCAVPAGGMLHPPLAIVSSVVISPRCLSSSGSLNITSPDAGN